MDLTYPLLAFGWIVCGFLSGCFWCVTGDRWERDHWIAVLFLGWTLGPLLLPLGTLVWGDRGLTFQTYLRHLLPRIRERRNRST
jgi:hypothetical protein